MKVETKPKPRFFIEGDVVVHNNIRYVVKWTATPSLIAYTFAYIEGCEATVDCRLESGEGNMSIPFDELELVEPAGVYMGAGLKSPILKKVSSNYNNVYPSKNSNYTTHPHYAQINANTWALFGAYGIDTLQLWDDGAWIIHYQQTKSQSIEPRFARAFLDKIGLTENYESRIGNQDEWDKVFNKEYLLDDFE